MPSNTASPASVATLVPYSGVQFLCVSLSDAQMHDAPSYRCKTLFDDPDALRLFPLTAHANGGIYFDSEGEVLLDESEAIHTNLLEIWQIFDGQWLPLPLLRQHRDSKDKGFDPGPLNWARFRCLKDEKGHQLLLAIDTQLLRQHPQRPYAAPTPEDASEAAQFALASALSDIDWLYQESWSREMIEHAFDNHLKHSLDPESLVAYKESLPALHVWAQYVALVECLVRSESVPAIQFINPKATRPVPVDLVLQLGPRESTGLLVEFAEDPTLPSQSQGLVLRCLSQPERRYQGPFPSQLAFHQPQFGNTRLSRRNRGDVFQWSSPARVGFEAQALAREADNHHPSGLQQPLRYLWDSTGSAQEWCFNPRDSEVSTPALQGLFFRLLDNSGKRTPAGHTGGVTRALYSRQAINVFFLAEVFAQALAQMNDWSSREKSTNPHRARALRRVLINLSDDDSCIDTDTLSRLASLALDGLRQQLKVLPSEIEIQCQIGAGQATQTLWLQQQIQHRYQNQLPYFFDGEHPQTQGMIVATLTLDESGLNLTHNRYQMQGIKGVHCHPLGIWHDASVWDQVEKQLIRAYVLPNIRRWLARANVPDIDTTLQSCFATARGTQDLLRPLARALLSRAQNARQTLSPQPIYVPIHTLTAEDNALSLAVLNATLRAQGVAPFDWSQQALSADLTEIHHTLVQCLRPILIEVTRQLHRQGCQQLLLEGGGTRLPAVQALLYEHGHLAHHAISHLQSLPVVCDIEHWGDCTAERQALGLWVAQQAKDQGLAAFHLTLDPPSAKSVDIGILNGGLNWSAATPLWRDIPWPLSAAAQPEPVSFAYYTPIRLAIKDSSLPEWPPSPFGLIESSAPKEALALPLQVDIQLDPQHPDLPLKIVRIVDANQQPCALETLSFTRQPLADGHNHWADQGFEVTQP